MHAWLLAPHENMSISYWFSQVYGWMYGDLRRTEFLTIKPIDPSDLINQTVQQQ
jgi:hypothetical protein